MESPIKFEMPKLSHADLLLILIPFAPGLLIAVDVTFSGMRPLQILSTAGVGYKTSVAVALLLIYLAGVTAIQITDLICALILTKFNPMKNTTLSGDLYWRHLAAKYVGSELSPEELHGPDTGTALQFLNQAGVKVQQETADWKSMSNSQEETAARQSLETKINRKLKDYAWLQLSVALQSLEDAEGPYVGYEVLMGGLQAAAASQVFVLVGYLGHGHVLLFLLALIMFLACSYARWQLDRIDNRQRDLNAAEIANLIKLIKNVTNREDVAG